MPRAKRGPKRAQRRKKVLKLSSGFFGVKSNAYRMAKQAVERAGKFATRDRRAKNVASVILVLSLGSGVKQFLVSEVSSFGSDIMQIEVKGPKVSKTSSANAAGQVGGTNITTFKLADAERVGRLENVEAWYAMLIGQQLTSFRDKKKQVMILGVTSGVTKADEKTEVEDGRMFSEEEDKSLAQVAVLGSAVKEYYFGDASAIGESIKIKGQTYRVSWTLKSRGMTGFFNFDETIYLPLETVQKKLRRR